MNLLPTLLRRLGQAAHARDARTLGATLEALARQPGWSGDVETFIARMPSGDAEFVDTYLNPEAPDSDGGAGFADYKPIHWGDGNPMSGVTKDATSNIYVPSSFGEWATTMQGVSTAGGPSALWLMQEASGNPADSIGSNTLTAASLTYQRSITGWTRKGAGCNTDGSGSASATLTGASIGDINTVSGLLLAYIQVTSTPAAQRNIMGLGSSTTYRGADVTTTPAYKAIPLDGSASATGVSNIGTSVRPVIVHADRTAGIWRVITNQEIVTPSPYTAPPNAGSGVFFGFASTTTADFSVLYAACFRSTAAELSNTQIRILLQKLGWTVAW